MATVHNTQHATEKQLLTHSRMASARRCLREHYYRYELGIVRDAEAVYYKVGAAIHNALELWHGSQDADAAVAAISLDDQYDHMMALALMDSYIDKTQPLIFDATEQQFEIPLVNPETQGQSRTFLLAGKIDGIITINGHSYIVEHKTTSEDIGPDSDYWLRLRVDPQISLYTMAARACGLDITGVLYNVIRKPALRPREVPELDADGLKICRDDVTGARATNKNGTWKQSAAEGCHLVTRPETPQEFHDRIRQDIHERPDHYFARREIPILDDHLAEFQSEVWQQAKLLMECQRSGYWFRNVSRVTCGNCQYASLCLQSIRVDPGQIPSGFVARPPHSELINIES